MTEKEDLAKDSDNPKTTLKPIETIKHDSLYMNVNTRQISDGIDLIQYLRDTDGDENPNKGLYDTEIYTELQDGAPDKPQQQEQEQKEEEGRVEYPETLTEIEANMGDLAVMEPTQENFDRIKNWVMTLHFNLHATNGDIKGWVKENGDLKNIIVDLKQRTANDKTVIEKMLSDNKELEHKVELLKAYASDVRTRWISYLNVLFQDSFDKMVDAKTLVNNLSQEFTMTKAKQISKERSIDYTPSTHETTAKVNKITKADIGKPQDVNVKELEGGNDQHEH